MKTWNEIEVKSLFEEVVRCKGEKDALKLAFKNHADKFGRKQNSVRNYYYHEVDNLKNDDLRCKQLGIDLSEHIKNHFIAFDKVGEENLFEEIDKLTKSGMSVRSACLKMSNGDLTLMTRYQNKYQNMKRKMITQNNNIIPFKQRTLTENDINSLFLGLVKLIKKTAMEEAMNGQEKQNSLLKKAFSDLSKKDKQIEDLKIQFESLKKENLLLLKQIKEDVVDKKMALKMHLDKNKAIKNEEDSKRV